MEPVTSAGVIETQEVIWRDDLLARVYRPDRSGAAGAVGAAGAAPTAVVVDIHGGAWNAGDRRAGKRYGEAIAAAGITVVAVDFRDGRVAHHPAAVDDVEAAVAWTRAHADELGVDPARLALVGSSSGGHLALLAALTRVEVCFVGAFWSPVDPLARYRYAEEQVGLPVPDGQAFDAARLVASTEAYFGTEAAMAGASISGVLRRGDSRFLPPVWLVRAGADLNVPPALLDDLVAAYRERGGQVELTDYPGEVHGFGQGTTPGADRFRADLVARLADALG